MSQLDVENKKMAQLDVDKWVEKSSSSESILFEQSTTGGDSTDSLTTKSGDDASNADSNETKAYDTSSTKSSEDEKRLQKHKKDILHRDIEKRRRDRINSSLTELRDLVPSAKLKLKNDGSNRTGRLQKARLLELTVDYLKSLKTTNNSKKDSSCTGEKTEDIQNALITESAQQIYVQAYKAGFCDAIKDITKTLPPQKSKEGLSAHLKSVNVPPIFLLSDSGRNKTNKNDLTSDDGKLIKGNTKTVNETFSSSYEQSGVIKDTSDILSNNRNRSASVDSTNTKTFYEKKDYFTEMQKPETGSLFDARQFSERSPVLISSYVLNEDKTKYYPTVLPLNVILEEAMRHSSLSKPQPELPTLYEKPQIGLKRPMQVTDYLNEERNKLYIQENHPRNHTTMQENELNFMKNLHSISKEELMKFQADLRNQFY